MDGSVGGLPFKYILKHTGNQYCRKRPINKALKFLF